MAAVRSILEQSYADWELIIVDDGSTDGTLTCLQQIPDSRVRIVANDKNQGLARSLNIAFGLSTHALIARMDADDVALPERLELQVAFLNSHPEIDVLGSSALFLGEQGLALRPETHEEMQSRIFTENPLIHPTVMMRRHVFESLGGYDDSLKRAQDYDLWFRGIKRFRYHNLQVPLIYYRRPARPTLRAACYSAKVIMINGWREGRPVQGCWFAARQLIALVVWKLRGVRP